MDNTKDNAPAAAKQTGALNTKHQEFNTIGKSNSNTNPQAWLKDNKQHTLGQILQSKKLMERYFFSVKKTHCFECKARLNQNKVKRMLSVWHSQSGVMVSPYQLCKPCAKKLQQNQFVSLPQISKDLAEADFNINGKDWECAGGVQ